jgi:hypothetical protein
MNRELCEKLWNDPEFKLISGIREVLDYHKTWNGMGWTYSPIRPERYVPLLKKIDTRLDDLCLNYGIDRNGDPL